MSRLKPKAKTQATATREQIIRQLVDDRAYPDVNSPILADVPEAERPELVQEAIDTFFEERAARRLPTLRERLVTWPPSAWGLIFCERPELERELTDAQAADWWAAREEFRRQRLRQTQKNVLRMSEGNLTKKGAI